MQLSYDVYPSNEDGLIQFANVQILYASEHVPSFDLIFLVDDTPSNVIPIVVQSVSLPTPSPSGNNTIEYVCVCVCV
jgi:hypothetical protein